MKAKDFLNSQNDIEKKEETEKENTNKDEIKKDQDNNNEKKDNNEKNVENNEKRYLEDFKNRIPKKEEKLIDEAIDEAANTMSEAIKNHDKAVKIKEQDEVDIKKFQKEDELQKNKDNKKNNLENILNIKQKSKTKNNISDGNGNLSKLDKLRSLSKRGRSVSFPLFDSGYIIKFYSLNTYIKTRNFFNFLQNREFGYFQSIDKLKVMYNNADFSFKDGDKLDFATWLEITSPTDLPIINGLWALANNGGKKTTTQIMCPECNTLNERTIDIKEIFENSFPDSLTEPFNNYDSTKPISELQKDLIIGREIEMEYIDQDKNIKYIINLSAPSLKKYVFVDQQIRYLIVDELDEFLPDEIMYLNDIDQKLQYLHQNKFNEVTRIHNLYTETLLYIDTIYIEDLSDTKDNFGNIQLSTMEDEIEELQEAVDILPDDLIDNINDNITKLTSDIEYHFKGKPFKCVNKTCRKIIKNDDINVGDLLFFTILGTITKK